LFDDVIVSGNFGFYYSRHENHMATVWRRRQRIVVNTFGSVWRC